MKHNRWKMFVGVVSIIAVCLCVAAKPVTRYSYSATIWGNLSQKQVILTNCGATDQKGGLLGHYLGEAVSICVDSTIPNDSVVIGAFSISSTTLNKCLPIKKWSKGAETVYAICDDQASDRCAVVSITTSISTLTEPLLKELIAKFVPNKEDAGDGK